VRIYYPICMSISGSCRLPISLRTDVAWHAQVLGTQHQRITMRWVLSMATPRFTDGDLGSLLHTTEHHLRSSSNVSRLRSQVSRDHVHYFHPCNFEMTNRTNPTWRITEEGAGLQKRHHSTSEPCHIQSLDTCAIICSWSCL